MMAIGVRARPSIRLPRSASVVRHFQAYHVAPAMKIVWNTPPHHNGDVGAKFVNVWKMRNRSAATFQSQKGPACTW